MDTKGEREGGRNWEIGVGIYTGWMNKKVLLCRAGNYIQCPLINHNRKEYEEECIHI